MTILDSIDKVGTSIQSAQDVSLFANLKITTPIETPVRRAYSITDDILMFRRCSRQYGYFKIRGYVPAQATQLYFGTVIHEVLDRAHRQFKGLMEGRQKGVPTDDDIDSYFATVTDSLRARGIRAYSRVSEIKAAEYLKRFNSRYGPKLYPRIVDTEHDLRIDMKNFYLHGVVDVLARSGKDSTSVEKEIWDYKGSKRPDSNSPEMKNYQFQMRVYAELYKRRNGNYPSLAVLCFLGEESYEDMMIKVSFDPEQTKKAMTEFISTVSEIERRIDKSDWSPPHKMPSVETCNLCDLRWDCPTVRGKFSLRCP